MKIRLTFLILLLLIACAREEPSELSYYHTFEEITSSHSPYLEIIDVEGSEHGPFALIGIRTFRPPENPNSQVETRNETEKYIYGGKENHASGEAKFQWQLNIFINKQEEPLFKLMKLHEGWEGRDSFDHSAGENTSRPTA